MDIAGDADMDIAGQKPEPVLHLAGWPFRLL